MGALKEEEKGCNSVVAGCFNEGLKGDSNLFTPKLKVFLGGDFHFHQEELAREQKANISSMAQHSKSINETFSAEIDVLHHLSAAGTPAHVMCECVQSRSQGQIQRVTSTYSIYHLYCPNNC